jgi:hypothetical protein
VDYSFAGNLNYSDATETSGNVRILRGATKESLPSNYPFKNKTGLSF